MCTSVVTLLQCMRARSQGSRRLCSDVSQATLAMKWRWKTNRLKQGKDISKPNIVFGANVQVCLHCCFLFAYPSEWLFRDSLMTRGVRAVFEVL